MARLSGLQREVLSLYRKCLRETRKKPTVLDFPKADAVSRRTEFREHQNYDKKDFSAIEYMLRKGQRQLEIYSSPGIRNVMK
ncbi:hypothetical protein D6C77_07787 [Aureobasidium pullulans]|uniref:Complex 1 LYR protein domain-containing protein n=1 Tax=Aureobasidium pullulans TaxID=5580 RepID=A0A4S9TXQ9_AURPU|nr:hypothetical protein D6D03_09412 [Aureobasidium pullulans]THY70370.1 hypothetical protein D6C94_08638 [Aureobasidium pullulans]THZ07572.1 hypothetical protein D6C93_00971 [Aureobasidium pullulans]THZ29365.1 hypothetical protein D6C89_02055 [Aureobasidium pullulans]THZ36820.1 hypothetical protein D6C87_08904 [Aureobasidium pullulans]